MLNYEKYDRNNSPKLSKRLRIDIDQKKISKMANDVHMSGDTLPRIRDVGDTEIKLEISIDDFERICKNVDLSSQYSHHRRPLVKVKPLLSPIVSRQQNQCLSPFNTTNVTKRVNRYENFQSRPRQKTPLLYTQKR